MKGIRTPTSLVGDWIKLSSGESKPLDMQNDKTSSAIYPVFGGNGIMGWSSQFNASGESIIIGRVGANCGCVHYYDGKCWITDNALYNKVNKCDYDKRFMTLLLTNHGLERLRSKTGQPLISQGPIHALKVSIPSIDEQQAIAHIADTWLLAINNTEILIEAKEKQLSFFRERFMRATNQTERIKLHLVTRELTTRNGKRLGRNSIMAVTKQVGMIPMKEETIAASTDRYKVVPPRAFAYNPMRINIGSIAMSPFAGDVLVSPDYVVFECNESRLLPGYLNHLRFSRHWRNYFGNAGSGSVRVRIYYDDLSAFTFDLPPIDVQRRIVRFLDASEWELNLLKQQAEAYRKQKRGLMQKLLTGEWRVKAD